MQVWLTSRYPLGSSCPKLDAESGENSQQPPTLGYAYLSRCWYTRIHFAGIHFSDLQKMNDYYLITTDENVSHPRINDWHTHELHIYIRALK